jgi:hypothetical protein
VSIAPTTSAATDALGELRKAAAAASMRKKPLPSQSAAISR